MKVHLLYRDRDADFECSLPENADALTQDLGLDALLDAMGNRDFFIRGISRHSLLTGLRTPVEIRYRLDALADCLRHGEVVRQLYQLAVEGVEAPKEARFFWMRDSADAQRQKALRMLELLTDILKRLRQIADAHGREFGSEAFSSFFSMLQAELDDPYLALLDEQLQVLGFRNGALISATLGPGNRGKNFVLRKPRSRGLIDRLTPTGLRGMGFSVSTRDEFGMRALGELRDRGVAQAANALAQSTDHVLGFFATLRAELAFYTACLNLRAALDERGAPVTLPEPADAEGHALSCHGLVDAVLVLHSNAGAVGSDLDADGSRLLVITGANEGGKSTFLRSLGVAQLMLQAGMFVTAESFRASVTSGVFSHFKREEDASMRSGKLDEELQRMSAIAEQIRPQALLLCNESFASTNEAEGSEIGSQVVHAFLENHIRVAYVTHMFDLARGLHEEGLGGSLFLRAERNADGTRTFRIVPGEPEPTSYGADSFRRIFGRAPGEAATRSRRAQSA